MSKTNQSETISNLVHKKSVEILTEVGFCVPDDNALARLDSAGFPIDHGSQMVRITRLHLSLTDSTVTAAPAAGSSLFIPSMLIILYRLR